MAYYWLQAKLRDGDVVNLDFSDFDLPLNQLMKIDYFTNQYTSWDFLELASKHVEREVSSEIESVQISIKGKQFCYSVCFQNPYLNALFQEIDFTPSIQDDHIPLNSHAFIEMTTFLFSHLEKKEDTFFHDYSYKNQLSTKINRYLHLQLFSEEDLREQMFLKQEIINEISKYKVYRSLCIYRRTLNRKENQIPRTIKKLDSQTHFEIVPKIFEPEIDEGESEIASQYVSSWENMMGEEREEFLSEDEIRQMVKTYG